MGLCGSCSFRKALVEPVTVSLTVDVDRFQTLSDAIGARLTIGEDKSMPPHPSAAKIELRVFLEERDLLKSLSGYISRSHADYLKFLLCWIDIYAFKHLNPDGLDQQRCAALRIYSKFLEPAATDCLKTIDFINILPSDLFGDSELSVDLFVDVQLHCFMELFNNVWCKYYNSHLYIDAIENMKRHNQINVDEFQYLEQIGRGHNGVVVHAVKTSTGKHYAIKIQNKVALMENFLDCPHRVCFERLALTRLNHPFIIGLDYAFQSEHWVALAMQLGQCKDIVYIYMYML